ncbi:hypothetical protein RWH45_12750 [Microbacterium sp. KSW4-17]|uniref:Uncharacterized protein n=1 Tax=Microbacterium galbum TaxID=3075994 RepID=A0ABU3T9K9_9MICO|nr:hypothetical protein [Microbacterium sp. KSW4-17]MDU0368086.1 hypothetical protein [Microbacterium sp. KSW4-17]
MPSHTWVQNRTFSPTPSLGVVARRRRAVVVASSCSRGRVGIDATEGRVRIDAPGKRRCADPG